MSFELTRLAVGAKGGIELTSDEFRAIVDSRAAIFECLAMEEKVDLLLENYTEFEQTLLDLSVRNVVFMKSGWSDFRRERHLINRRLVNLLSTGRMYVDQIPHHLNNLFGGESTQSESFKAATSREYDEHLGYRAMYALRNFVQHRGFPVQGLTHFSKWLDGEDEKRAVNRNTMTGYIFVEHLAEEKQFKQAILEELREIGEKIDIKPMIREYMSSIGRLHDDVRQSFSNELLTWKQTLKSAEQRFLHQHPGHTVGLAAVERNESGQVVGKHSILDEAVELLDFLMTKNHGFTHLVKHYVSSEVFSD